MSNTETAGWLRGRLPEGWTVAELTVDRDEALVVISLPAPDAGDADPRQVEAGRIAGWREDTREQRVGISRETEKRFGRVVAWGAVCGETRQLFTTHSSPVMTRLRQPERIVLDTLVEAGVARSRSHALAWCVKLVGEHAEEWLGELRTALEQVEKVRAAGPGA